MEIQDFAGIAVVGSVLSIVQEWVNKKYEISSLANRLIVVGLAIVFGGVYFVLRSTTWWTTILGVLVCSSAFYALLLKKDKVE